jgi:putative hydrolase of the HAD superfamily
MGDKQLVLFIDSGDTLVDEGTQVWGEDDIVLETGLIEGAEAALKVIHERGYLIALVADGRDISFENVYLRQYGLRHCFDAWIVSETLGVSKPAAEMFQGAMDALNLGPADKGRVVMVGNNLSRDVRGANLFGITSIWIDWSPRYPREGRDGNEVPDYTIHSPAELPPLLEKLDAALKRGESIKPAPSSGRSPRG